MGNTDGVRPSGYVSRLEELWYGQSGPFYDLMTWWALLPLGGEKKARREMACWVAAQPGHCIASLCCGTGSGDRAILEIWPDVHITGVDLGKGQVACARKHDPKARIDYRVANAAETGLSSNAYDRVVITLALHEMPRELRLAILREAARICKPDGQVVAIEHARPNSWPSGLLRALWWFYWVPFNPEFRTTKDLQRHGLANEMNQSGLDVLETHTSQPAWIEGVAAQPRAG